MLDAVDTLRFLYGNSKVLNGKFTSKVVKNVEQMLALFHEAVCIVRLTVDQRNGMECVIRVS